MCMVLENKDTIKVRTLKQYYSFAQPVYAMHLLKTCTLDNEMFDTTLDF